jgi:hypothetical protein
MERQGHGVAAAGGVSRKVVTDGLTYAVLVGGLRRGKASWGNVEEWRGEEAKRQR